MAQDIHDGLARDAEIAFDAAHLHCVGEHAREPEWNFLWISFFAQMNIRKYLLIIHPILFPSEYIVDTGLCVRQLRNNLQNQCG
jgi:hypothetical protein